MSIPAMNAVWNLSPARGSVRLVLLALADRADENGYCWPSITWLEKKTLMSRRGVTVALSKLVKAGELLRDRGTREKTTGYWIRPGSVSLGEGTDAPRERRSLGNKATGGREQRDLDLGNTVPPIPNEIRHKKRKRASRASRVAAPEFLAQLWNERAGGRVQPIGELTPTRKKLAARAWQLHPEADWWRSVLDRAYRSRFLRGAKGWAMTFNWLISKDNAVQILEGVHDNKPGDCPNAEERALAMVQRTRGQCRHVPVCRNEDEHFNRLVDRVLGIEPSAMTRDDENGVDDGATSY